MENYEKVEKIREKTGVSYEDAKNALEACGYDMLDALVYLEKLGKIQSAQVNSFTTNAQDPSDSVVRAQVAYEQSCKKKTFAECVESIFRWVGDVVKKGMEKDFVVERHGQRVMGIPIVVFILLLVFAFWITVPLLIIGLFCDCKYHFEGEHEVVQEINNLCDKASEFCTKDDEEK
ncbi:MAG: DUF4342 domain-containing protein [Wujia sp.]